MSDERPDPITLEDLTAMLRTLSVWLLVPAALVLAPMAVRQYERATGPNALQRIAERQADGEWTRPTEHKSAGQ
jgi:hypothetical protein